MLSARAHNEYYELVKGLNNAGGICLAADWNTKPYRIRMSDTFIYYIV